MDASFTASVFLGMSVDGFIARPDGDLAWLTGGDADGGGAPDDGEGGGVGAGAAAGRPPARAPAGAGGPGGGGGGDFGFAEFVAGIDALVMGRGTYEVIA